MSADPSTALSLAIVAMAARGERPACGEPDQRDLFTGEDPNQRARAQLLCRNCPAADPCLDVAFATKATAGVWAGHDFQDITPRARAKLRAQVARRTPESQSPLI